MFIEKIIDRERFRREINNDNDINKTIINKSFCLVLSRLNISTMNTNQFSFLFCISFIAILKSRLLLIFNVSSSLWYQIPSKSEIITSFFFKIFFYISKFRFYAMISFNNFFYFINFIVLQQLIFNILLNDCFVSTILFLIVVHVKNSRNILFSQKSREFETWMTFVVLFFRMLNNVLDEISIFFLYFNVLLFILWISSVKILNFHSINIFDDFDSKRVWIWQNISCNRVFVVTKAKNVSNT